MISIMHYYNIKAMFLGNRKCISINNVLQEVFRINLKFTENLAMKSYLRKVLCIGMWNEPQLTTKNISWLKPNHVLRILYHYKIFGITHSLNKLFQ